MPEQVQDSTLDEVRRPKLVVIDVAEGLRVMHREGIKWVRQEHANGCGLAALAMLLGYSYAEALALVTEHVPDHSRVEDWDASGTSHYLIDFMLAKSGGYVQRRYPVWDWPMEPFAPAHYASVRQPSGKSHFVVVRDDGSVLDPMREGVHRLGDWSEVNQITGVVWP